MIDMNIDFPLKEIDISNTPEEEVLLVSDLPINRQIKFSFILPIFFFIVLSLLSIFLPNAEYSQSIEDNLSQSSQFSVWNTVSQLAPIYKYFLLKFDLKSSKPYPNANLSGNISIKIYENDILSQKYNQEILSRPVSEPIYLFSSQLINFDKVVTIFNFSTSEEISGNAISTITSSTMSTICSLFVSFIRILFSLFLFFLFFGSTNFFIDIDSALNNNDKNTDKIKKAPNTVEQKITFFLILCAFLYADPFDVVNLKYPSKFSRTIAIFLRDFFYSYIMFYIHALFSYFTRDPLENQLISLLFPYLFMAITLILFWINDADIYLQNEPKVFPFMNTTLETSFLTTEPPTFPTLENLSTIHLLYFAFLFISSIAQIIITGIKVFKSKIEHTQRWIFYSSTTITLLISLSIYVILKLFFIHLIENTIFDQSYIFVVCMCYVLLMEFGHEETDIEKKDLYVMHDDDNRRNIGQIGGISNINDHSLEVDEDVEKLKEKKNKNDALKAPEIKVTPVQIPSNENSTAPADTQK